MLQLAHCISSLPFQYPFTTSKGTKDCQKSLVVELTWGPGIKAYGEAPAIDYYNVTVEQMQSDLESKRKFIESFSFMDPKRFWHFLHHLFPANPFLVSALDMAGWDLYGKMKRKSLSDLWNSNTNSSLQTDYTIGIDTIDMMLNKIDQHPAPIYKIKVGTADDLEKLVQIRKRTNSVIRIDANAAWSFDQALVNLPILNQLHIELIEQPLSKDNYDGTVALRKLTEIPIIADESCVGFSDIEKCKDAFTGINIKLTKCSGITPALEMIKKAKQLGLTIMLGCMNESTIGTAALGHLSHMVDYLDADGPMLLSTDIATGIQYDNFKLTNSQEAGLGIRLNSFPISI
jgi:L-alanine-DL-glutamate epimerase-like enolase superfamily enzyme